MFLAFFGMLQELFGGYYICKICLRCYSYIYIYICALTNLSMYFFIHLFVDVLQQWLVGGCIGIHWGAIPSPDNHYSVPKKMNRFNGKPWVLEVYPIARRGSSLTHHVLIESNWLLSHPNPRLVCQQQHGYSPRSHLPICRFQPLGKQWPSCLVFQCGKKKHIFFRPQDGEIHLIKITNRQMYTLW